MLNSQRDIGFFLAGFNYGYPICCINSFIKDVNENLFASREQRKLDGTGFIPCPECNSRYTEEELISIIESNRLVENEFLERKSYIKRGDTYIMKNLLSHCASVSNPPKTYPTLEIGMEVAQYRGSRTLQLCEEGFSYEEAAKKTNDEIFVIWGEPK